MSSAMGMLAMFDCKINHSTSKCERIAAVDVRKVGLNAPFEEEQEDSHQQFLDVYVCENC